MLAARIPRAELAEPELDAPSARRPLRRARVRSEGTFRARRSP
nr:MAG TPA: hypothetical protein [Caudoviricetes sp.]